MIRVLISFRTTIARKEEAMGDHRGNGVAILNFPDETD